MSQSELKELISKIESKYPVEVSPVRIGGKVLKILQIKDYEDFLADLIEKKNVGAMDLPFWAKVWEASLLLAYFLGKQPVTLGHDILEIGAGLGITGVYAAMCGHRVTISDIDEDALLFCRANVLLNDVPHTRVMKLDWNDAKLPAKFNIIAGSEVVYDRKSYPALVGFLRKALTHDGIFFLAKNAQLNAPMFFTELLKYFEFKQTVQKIRLDGEPQDISLYAIRFKQTMNAA